MTYNVIWMKGDKVVEEDEFDGLMETKVFILDHLIEKENKLGVTCVEVCGNGMCCFKIEAGTRTKHKR